MKHLTIRCDLTHLDLERATLIAVGCKSVHENDTEVAKLIIGVRIFLIVELEIITSVPILDIILSYITHRAIWLIAGRLCLLETTEAEPSVVESMLVTFNLLTRRVLATPELKPADLRAIIAVVAASTRKSLNVAEFGQNAKVNGDPGRHWHRVTVKEVRTLAVRIIEIVPKLVNAVGSGAGGTVIILDLGIPEFGLHKFYFLKRSDDGLYRIRDVTPPVTKIGPKDGLHRINVTP